MAEWRLFQAGTVPEYSTPEWYAGRERAPHVDQDLHRERLEITAAMVDAAAVWIGEGTASVVDLGAGDGGLLSLLKDHKDRGWGLPAWGYDLQPTNVAGAAERGVDVRYGDILGPIEWGTIAVATELLEHLVDPHAMVRRIAEHSRVLIASSPWNETPHSHYEYHLWTWDETGYRAVMEQAGFRVIRHRQASIFQIVFAIRDRDQR